jgi:hypothetical protein
MIHPLPPPFFPRELVRLPRRASVILSFALSLAAASAVSSTAQAAPPTKEECIETHGRAQDTRDRGQLADAKRMFMLCAQATCPALVQSDCAKFGEELSRAVPSVSFSARDPKGGDLPDTQVFIDGTLVASRLDDGKAHDVDPGKHSVRFVRNGREATVSVVIAVGERGRNISVTLGEPGGGASASETVHPVEAPPRRPSRPIFPLFVAGIGGAALVTGAVLGFVGLGRVPEQCSTSPRECAAPPGDKVFTDAKSAINLANTGLGIGIVGLVVGIGGLVWYFMTPPTQPAPTVTGMGSGGAMKFSF